MVPYIIMPICTKIVETGEKLEDKALLWDSINAATYTKVGDLKPFSADLLKAHQVRIVKDPVFQYIQQNIAHFHAM